jgi:hypothetical protein
MKKTGLFIAVTLAAILAACTGQNNPPVTAVPEEIITPEVGQLDSSVPSHDALDQALTAQDRDHKPKMDWLDAIELFAQKYPSYAGFSVSEDRKKLTMFTSATDKKSEKGEEVREEFLELIGKTMGFPEATDVQGRVVQPKKLKFAMSRVKYPLSRIYPWRVRLREILSLGLVNRVSINEEGNVINLQIANESNRTALNDFLAQKGIPTDVVSISVGENVRNKTLLDAFSPPVGGVDVNAGGIGCSVGLPVSVDNVSSYLLASHCSLKSGVSSDGSVLKQAGVTIGNKSFDNAFFACSGASIPGGSSCQTADAAFYTAVGPFTRARIIFPIGGVGSTTTANVDTYYDVTAVSDRPALNEVLSSIGSSTGYRDFKVVNADTDYFIPTNASTGAGIVVKRTVQVARSGTTVPASCQGDSGGPVFQITGTSTAKFLGVISASLTDAPDKTLPGGAKVKCGFNAFFTPLAQIRSAYPTKVLTFTR